MDRLDLKVGFACNNFCLFCVQWDKRTRHAPRPLDEIKDILVTESKRGIHSVVFTGGEPTMHPNLIEAVAFARDHGYYHIQIQSNGRKFANMDYLKSLVSAGANEFSPAIHGFKEETHDFLTCVPGSWRQAIEGIMNIRKLRKSLSIITNTVVTKQNYKEMPQLAALLVKLGVNQFQFAFVHIAGSADKNKLTIVPKKTDAIGYLKQGLDIGKAAGVPCMIEAMPYCLMQGYEWAISEQIIPTTTVYDANIHMEDYAEYRTTEGKAKREECKKCSKYTICEGPWCEYPDLFGWDEFQPIID